MDAITYQRVDDEKLIVFLGAKIVGEIRPVLRGFRYFPNGKKGGELFPTEDAVKTSLESF